MEDRIRPAKLIRTADKCAPLAAAPRHSKRDCSEFATAVPARIGQARLCTMFRHPSPQCSMPRRAMNGHTKPTHLACRRVLQTPSCVLPISGPSSKTAVQYCAHGSTPRRAIPHQQPRAVMSADISPTSDPRDRVLRPYRHMRFAYD